MNLIHHRHLQLDPEADGLVKGEQPAFPAAYSINEPVSSYQKRLSLLFLVQCIWK